MRRLFLAIVLLAFAMNAIHANNRNDKLKEQPIESILYHKSNEKQVVNIIYLNGTYSRHEFNTKKERRQFVRRAKKYQASIETIIKSRRKRALQDG